MTMSIREDGTLGQRPLSEAPTSHPWRWLATIICGAIICFALVATIGTFVTGGLNG
jgi:hypothetical protein